MSDSRAGWSYAGGSGPDAWGRLDPAYAACEVGRAQSPIDLRDAVEARGADPAFAYARGPVTLRDLGPALQADPAPGNTCRVEGRVLELVEMHIHVPSEHAIDGQAFAAEAHFVHYDSDGRRLVVGLLLVVGAPRPAFDPLLAGTTLRLGEEIRSMLDWPSLLPPRRSTFRYDGSLTTPPCTEGVRWIVLREPASLSWAQLDTFAAVHPHNARPLQPRNGRQVVAVSEA
jgi:carbonic anhydrase